MVELIYNILNTAWQVVLNWWWVPVPFLIFGSDKKMGSFRFMWLWWRRETWIFAQKMVLLEIKMPKEVLKPLRSMEQVFTSIWGNVYDPPDWWEKWFEGKMLLSVQLEMISLNGEPHLYVRCHESRRNAVEASIYSQYPEAEISLADDYTKYVPQDVPSKNWDIWGSDYELAKLDIYPIKTYPKFFEEKEAVKEEKRIDPMATLLEGFGTMGPGEQLWIQIAASPVTNAENNFVDRGRKEANKLAKRPEEAKMKPILQEAFDEVAYAKVPGAEESREELKIEALLPVEARMTPGERDIVAGVEGKIAKRCFDSYIRFVYLAKRDVYFGGAKAVPFGFFQQFATENLNLLKPFTKTITKIHRYPVLDLLRTRRLFIRKRRLFYRYIKRMSPLFPRPGGTFILDSEELATIFHFPGHTVAPAPFVSRVEAKRGEAPPGLPIE